MAERLRSRDQAAVAKQRTALRYRTISDLGGNLIGKGAKWGTLAYISYQGRLAVEALAGHTTVAEFIMALGMKVSIAIALSWTVSAGAAALLIRERRLRHRDIKRLAGRVQHFEKTIDPRRSSSLLTATGTTRPEDET